MFDRFRKKKKRAERKYQRLEEKIGKQYAYIQEWEIYNNQVHGQMRSVALEMENKRKNGMEYIR